MSPERMFMWAWQETFYHGFRDLAAETLGRLGNELTPHVFVLGIRETDADRAICFEPEDCGYEVSEFAGVRARAKRLLEADPSRNMILGAPHLHDRLQASLHPKAIRGAVLEVLNASQQLRAFCSFPVLMDGYWVMGVVEVSKDALQRLPTLRREYAPYDVLQRRRMTCSLLDGVINSVLREGSKELASRSRGESIQVGDPDRVLEDAGRAFAGSAALSAGLGGTDLWMLANEISAAYYESAQCRGRLLLAARPHPGVSSIVQFAEPIRLGNRRAIRKLLETTGDHSALLAGSEGIWGLGNPNETYDGCSEDLFEVRFTSHYTWEIIHHGERMMTVKYRQPSIPRPRIDEGLVRDHAERLFPDQSAEVFGRLVLAAQAASGQRHGTMLVVSAQAESEAQRLKTESTVVEPVDLTPELVSALSSIDGAMLVSPDVRLYAFGAILDGHASGNGNSARGARFNSAIRYADACASKGIPVLILIVSEDGYVDLYPRLPPRIRRSTIDDALARLERAINTDGPLDVSPVWDAVNFLGKHRMYLRPDDVARANVVKAVVVARSNLERAAAVAGTMMIPITVSVADFEVIDEMDDRLHLPEPDVHAEHRIRFRCSLGE